MSVFKITEVYVDASVRDVPQHIRSQISREETSQRSGSLHHVMDCTRVLRICDDQTVPVAGIGVYIPGDEARSSGYTVCTNRATISRAEVIATRTALILTFKDPSVVIHTDSQHVMLALSTDLEGYIKRKWLVPSMKSYMAESDISRQCAELIRLRSVAGKSTRISKVVAHSGNEGNTIADQFAYAAAYGTSKALLYDDVEYCNGVAINANITRTALLDSSKQLGIGISLMEDQMDNEEPVGEVSMTTNRRMDSESYGGIDTEEVNELVMDQSDTQFRLCMLCVSCPNPSVVLIEHHDQTLNDGMDVVMVATYCRTCIRAVEGAKGGDTTLATAFNNSKINAVLLKGSDVVRAVANAISTEPVMLTADGHVKYMSSRKVFTNLTQQDRVHMINVNDESIGVLHGGFF